MSFEHDINCPIERKHKAAKPFFFPKTSKSSLIMDSVDHRVDAQTSTLSAPEIPQPSSPPIDSAENSNGSVEYLRPSKASRIALSLWQWFGRCIQAANSISVFVLVISICVAKSVITGRASFLYGILVVLLLQMSKVAGPWVEYVGSDDEIRKLLTFIRGWRRFFIGFVQRHGGKSNKEQDHHRIWWHWWGEKTLSGTAQSHGVLC